MVSPLMTHCKKAFFFQLFFFPPNFESRLKCENILRLENMISVFYPPSAYLPFVELETKSVLNVISKTCFPTHNRKRMKQKPSNEICFLWPNYFNQILKLCKSENSLLEFQVTVKKIFSLYWIPASLELHVPINIK